MAFWRAVCIAFSTYSILPAPHCEWNDKALRHSLCALPLVGLPLGGLLLGWAWLCANFSVGALLFCALAALLPLLMTGGIHLDGFCDTVDALASHQPPERRLEILKDPHVGAFAVLYSVALFLLTAGLFSELGGAARLADVAVVSFGFVLTRALTALAALHLPRARRQGMLHTFAAPADRRLDTILLLLQAVAAAVAMIAMHPVIGGAAVAVCLAVFFLTCRAIRRGFGGATGDTAGFTLQICELALLAGAVAAGILIRGAGW